MYNFVLRKKEGNMEEKNIKDFFSNLKDKITDSTGVSSIVEQLDRLNNNLDKFSRDSDCYKQEITKLNNNLDKITKEDIDYFKNSMFGFKVCLVMIAAALFVLAIGFKYLY